MSLGKSLFEQIEVAISTFIENIAEKYDLDKDELAKLWSDKPPKALPASKKSQPTTLSETIDMDDISHERLIKSSKAELSALCKSKGCKCTGTKDVLIARLLGKDEPVKEKKTASKVAPAKKAETKTVKKSTNSKALETVEVIKKITKDVPTIPIRTNTFGRLEHAETRFVFDNKKSKKVIGKQQDDGTVIDLTDEDIEECKRFKFAYEIPKNLDKETLDKVKIDEVDDDSEVEVEVEVEVEDEEDADEEDEVEVEEDDDADE